MKIFVRQSKAAYMDAPELFKIVSTGITFFENFFKCEFPFSKYDQIFVPEFRISGMENVGAIAFTDNFLKPIEE
jgi:aminopeptidase N